MNKKITIIDYGIGNTRSIQNALEKFQTLSILSRDRDEILNSSGIILPGVGAFATGMKNLNKFNLVEVLSEVVKRRIPLMGICLGMQMLFDKSEEFVSCNGLGFIKGEVKKLELSDEMNLKLPHISWNEINTAKLPWDNSILHGISSGEDMYFVHSYASCPIDKSCILSETEYSGHSFCSTVQKGLIYGCQFHPERSGEKGLKILNNFVNICKKRKS